MNIKEIHIGNLVKTTVKQNGYTLAEVARKIGISRQTLNGWLLKDDISVKDLFTISEVTEYDFLKMFCQPIESEQETKVVLQIEVEKSKTNDILKFIKDKQLYNILKKE